MRSARDQSPLLPNDVLGISLQRVPHVEAWRVGCHLSSPPHHSTGVPNDTVCIAFAACGYSKWPSRRKSLGGSEGRWEAPDHPQVPVGGQGPPTL
ncbi:hypothetical protein TNCV_3860931 [Trichonephila clavipes]|nr:hypothetical protein TNCV_3860931 [Trichonephila clavipes]